MRNNSLYPWLAVSIARSVPHGWYTPFISQGNAAVGLERANARAREHMHFDESVVDHEQTCGAGKLCATTLSISLYRSLGVYTPSFLKALADACKLIVLS